MKRLRDTGVLHGDKRPVKTLGQRPWTDKEDQFIIDHYSSMSDGELESALNRSSAAIQGHIVNMRRRGVSLTRHSSAPVMSVYTERVDFGGKERRVFPVGTPVQGVSWILGRKFYGKVVWVHPQKHFVAVEIEGPHNNTIECFDGWEVARR